MKKYWLWSTQKNANYNVNNSELRIWCVILDERVGLVGDMTREELEVIHIEKPDERVYQQVMQVWDSVAKPLNGLGRFEAIIAQIGAIHGSVGIDLSKKAIIAMCADNGIVQEGVSQSGQEVTSIVTQFMGQNKTSVGKMASVIGVDVIPVDIGVNNIEAFPGVRQCKVAMGTRNFLKEAAMTEEQALKAIQVGIDLVRECKEKGYQILGTGEMGIGNTTTSSAIAAALTGCEVECITGRGAGLSDEGLQRKIQVITQALQKYGLGKEDWKEKQGRMDGAWAWKTLLCVGGLDIAGLVGVYIGGALYHCPIVMDGVISTVAALMAERLVPGVKNYMIASHKSKEPAVEALNQELGIIPIIDGQLALGEGTGAVMMFSLLDMALALYDTQTTFEEMAIDQYERFV